MPLYLTRGPDSVSTLAASVHALIVASSDVLALLWRGRWVNHGIYAPCVYPTGWRDTGRGAKAACAPIATTDTPAHITRKVEIETCYVRVNLIHVLGSFARA